MAEKLKILFIANELAPLTGTGELAEVINSLPQALVNLGVDIRIVIPKYQLIDEKKYPQKLLTKIKVGFADKIEDADIYTLNLPPASPHFTTAIPVYLIHKPQYLNLPKITSLQDIGFQNSKDALLTYTFFAKAILECWKDIDWAPDLFHCHNWQTAILPLLNKLTEKPRPTLLTIHNLNQQGEFPSDLVLGLLGQDLLKIPSIEHRLADYDTINCLEQGILHADLINATSPAYATEILTPEFGYGLEKVLLKRRPQLFGILNGINTERFNPETDLLIKHNYLITNLDGKLKNKKELQSEIKFKINAELPIICMVSHLTGQRGLDILLPALKKLAKEKAQFVFLGTGEPKYEKALGHFNNKKNIFVKIGVDETLAHQIYAASDFFLLPSKFEPCGLGQMMAMRYGALPIVRSTGGLKDTVTEIGPDEGTGFLFSAFDKNSLLKTVERALLLYRTDKIAWQKAQIRAMGQDFSWTKSAKKYLELYHSLV